MVPQIKILRNFAFLVPEDLHIQLIQICIRMWRFYVMEVRVEVADYMHD